MHWQGLVLQSLLGVLLCHCQCVPKVLLVPSGMAIVFGPLFNASQVSLSSVVMPMVKMVPRGFTAAADAYLTPHILR